ncbi:DUF4199 domain-containing protein [Mesonia sp. MT50]|uniref:DUF4199 domain-containing protein n=1 Tax=Mesonia profundi TaxID=3070998 RepID=A0ABU1A039_9FLAO|nr:DUF4199 domain-containing protein [Mesonia profundi]MDQ7917060.1 DUF4199 domain-containing protein [Mesonia profundi]
MKNFKTEIKWALIFSFTTLFWMYLEKNIGLHDKYIAKQAIYTNLIAIPYIILFYLAIKEKKHEYFKGVMTWQQGLVSGGIMSVLIAILAPLVQYIVSKSVTPQYFENIISYTVESGTMSQESAQAYFSLKSYMIQSVFGSLAMGVVTSAIVSLFLKTPTKKKK